MSAIRRFLGDSPLRVLLKLLVVSFLVGLALSAFGLTPWDIWYTLRDFVLHLWDMGFAAVERFGDYILLGAVIVVPIFIILRILSYRKY